MIGNDIFKFSHPEKSHLVQHHALEGNRLVHDDIERGHAVSGDNQQGSVVNLVNIPNLAAIEQGVFLYVGLGNNFHFLPNDFQE